MTKEEQLELAREKAAEANKGNTHSSKINRLLSETLKRRLIQEEALRANLIVESLLSKAEEGDLTAINMVFDRMEGKPVAKQEISGVDGEAIALSLPIEFKDANRTVPE
jgi:hypothetical protein